MKSPSEEIPLMGHLQDWRIVIGGILDCSGLHGFLGNLDQMYEDADINNKTVGGIPGSHIPLLSYAG